MSRPTRTPVYGLVIVLGLSLYSWPLQAGVQLDIVAKFQTADLELDVVTVIDSDPCSPPRGRHPHPGKVSPASLLGCCLRFFPAFGVSKVPVFQSAVRPRTRAKTLPGVRLIRGSFLQRRIAEWPSRRGA